MTDEAQASAVMARHDRLRKRLKARRLDASYEADMGRLIAVEVLARWMDGTEAPTGNDAWAS